MNRQPKPTKKELAYFAGYLDGEGCFRVSRNTLCVSINNTYPAVLFKFQKHFGGNVRLSAPSNNRFRTIWNYTVYGIKAKKLLEALLPYLEEKYLQATLLLELCEVPKTNKTRRDEIKMLITALKRVDYFK